MKVLIIEDEALIQKTLKLLFSKKGCITSATNSGHTAIELIKNEDFDLIICDLMLQDITGVDVIEESKQKYTPEQIAKKFVIITAYSSEQILDKIKKYGCTIYSKPFADVNLVIDSILRDKNE